MIFLNSTLCIKIEKEGKENQNNALQMFTNISLKKYYIHIAHVSLARGRQKPWISFNYSKLFNPSFSYKNPFLLKIRYFL